MTFREQLDCPLCHRGTVEVLVYGPEPPFDTSAWSIQGISQVEGCDHAELIDCRLMSGDIDLYDDIAKTAAKGDITWDEAQAILQGLIADAQGNGQKDEPAAPAKPAVDPLDELFA